MERNNKKFIKFGTLGNFCVSKKYLDHKNSIYFDAQFCEKVIESKNEILDTGIHTQRAVLRELERMFHNQDFFRRVSDNTVGDVAFGIEFEEDCSLNKDQYIHSYFQLKFVHQLLCNLRNNFVVILRI